MSEIFLALAGFLSGWLTVWSALGSPAGAIAAGLLGLILAAYLWLRAGVRSEAGLIGVVVMPVIGHLLMVVMATFSLALLNIFGYDPDTTGGLVAALTGASGAALVAPIFLAAAGDQRHLVLETAFCATAGALACFISNFSDFVSGVTVLQMPLWNGGVAAALAFVTYLRSRPAAPQVATLRRLTRAGLLGCVLMVLGGTLFFATPRPAYLTAMEERQAASLRDARIRSLNEAPPFADLAEIPVVPTHDIFTRVLIAGMTCDSPSGDRLAGETRMIESHQLRVPSRHKYHLQCHVNVRGTVYVEIIQYPNDAWARYDLRFQGGEEGLLDPIDVKTVAPASSNGRPLFVIGSTKALWSSGDKAIVIGGTAPPEVLDAFIDAYLERYPSTLDPGFELPYLPPR